MLEELKTGMDNAKTSEARREIARKTIDEIAPELAPAVEEIQKLFQEPIQSYKAASALVRGERFMNLQLLWTSTEPSSEYKWQKDVASRNSTAAKVYHQTFLASIERIDAASLSGKAVVAFRDGVVHSKDVAELTLGITSRYPMLLDILEAEHGRWKLEEDYPIFESQEQQLAYDAITDAALDAESKAAKLSSTKGK